MKKMYSFVLFTLFIGQTIFAQSIMDGVVQKHFNGTKAKSEAATSDMSEWKVTDIVPSLNPKIQHVYVQQYYKGIPVQDGTYKLNVTDKNTVTWEINQFKNGLDSKLTTKSTSISAENAILKVAGVHKMQMPTLAGAQKKSNGTLVYVDKNVALTPIEAQQVYVLHNNELRLTWKVSLYQKDGKHWWVENVDVENGNILASQDFVITCNFDSPDHTSHNHANTNESILEVQTAATKAESMASLAGESYNVYAMPFGSPDDGGRSIVTDPSDPVASPFGWHDTNGSAGAEFTNTRGNNVLAQDDSNGNNGSGATADGGANLAFDFPVDLGQAPATYRDASIVNLFYWNNIMHDVFYQYGFDEASGNFQENNYGNGGRGGDYVFADAQDGSGTNNANFATPADGSNPRMQMFLWNQTRPGRDGDFDNVIIAHEYGHGISIRIVGGPSNSGALGRGGEQMGEGWSDYFGLMLTMQAGDRATDGVGVGTYVLGQGNNGAGIRPTRYSTDRSINGTDYSDINRLAVPHGVGYGFATILWDMTWGLIDEEGFDPDFYNGTGGNNISMALVIEGLKNTANNPGYVSGRDGILQADRDLYGGKYECIIWKAFAERGVGRDADENNNGGSNSNTDQTVSFENPCDSTPPPPPAPVECTGDVSVYPYNEGFEGNVGDWNQLSTDDIDWTVNSGGTPSNNTGPDGAADGNSYIYVEASGEGDGFPNKVATLDSPCIDLSGLSTPTLGFKYHMLGSSVNSLTVSARTDNTGDWSPIFERSGAQGANWNTASVDLAAYAGESSVQLRITAVTGSGNEGWQSDIAIDTLSITNGSVTPPPPPPPPTDDCSSTVDAFPYSESYEGNIGDWTQDANDDIDWDVNSGGTPSNNTGPTGASDGSSYIYVEASGEGTGFPNKVATLNSPCYDFSDLPTPALGFDYHMRGSSINSLTVEARTDNEGNWTSVFNKSGAQGNDWNTANVDLSAYEGEASVQLRITAVTGSGSEGWQSDIAIDALSIKEGGSTPPPPPPPPGGCDTIDFNSVTVSSYANQDRSRRHSITNGGDGITVSRNSWRTINFDYTITPNTVLEFEFASTDEGEINGIGFDNDNSESSDKIFKLYGSENYGITNYDTYSGGTQTFVIPVGSFYTGPMDRMVFVSDSDRWFSNSNSQFTNVKVYEGSCGTFTGDIATQFGNVTPEYGDRFDTDISGVSVTPNPTRDNFTINIPATNRTVTATVYSILGSVKSQVKLNSGVNNISARNLSLSAGIYLIKIESPGVETLVQKLVIQ